MPRGRCDDPKKEEARRAKIAAARQGRKHAPLTVAQMRDSQRERREREAGEV
jgi:hypothetical protein